MHWCRSYVLSILMAITLAWGGTSFAAEGPAESGTATAPAPTPVPVTESAPATEPATVQPENYLDEKKSSFGQTMDETHEYLERSILRQVIRLDDFFGDVKTEEQRPSSYELRWRNSFRVEKGGHFRYGTSARANVVLAKISRRFRLFISGDDVADPFAPSLPEDPGNPGYDRTINPTRLVNTELRYSLIKTRTLDFFLGAGVQLSGPIGAFARTRAQYMHNFNNIFLLRLAETLFVKSNDLFGETTEISLDRLLRPKTVFRWSASGTASKEIDGIEWGSELSLIHEISPKSAITLTGGGYGNSSFAPVVQNYRLLALYRQNFLRKWLFYELEPQISWPRGASGGYPANVAVTFRLEIVFKGSAKDGQTVAAYGR
jgi:hypothetical protein